MLMSYYPPGRAYIFTFLFLLPCTYQSVKRSSGEGARSEKRIVLFRLYHLPSHAWICVVNSSQIISFFANDIRKCPTWLFTVLACIWYEYLPWLFKLSLVIRDHVNLIFAKWFLQFKFSHQFCILISSLTSTWPENNTLSLFDMKVISSVLFTPKVFNPLWSLTVFCMQIRNKI